MIFSEEQLKAYAAPLSDTEDQKCKNAIAMVRDAIKELGFTDDNKAIGRLYEDTLAYSLQMRSLVGSREIKLFVQGSYANNTNVRKQSDVDIAVVQEDVFEAEFRAGVIRENYDFRYIDYPAKTYKDEVQSALVIKFGGDVERENNSIRINGNDFRKETDTVPCRRFRDYKADYRFDQNNYIGAIAIFPDDGEMIINYPEQHIMNGRVKNNATNYSYKKMVRIIKNIRYLMEDKRIASALNIGSFGLESLLWNIPDETYTRYTSYQNVLEDILDFMIKNTLKFFTFKEANGIKFLCPTHTERENYTRFISDLCDLVR